MTTGITTFDLTDRFGSTRLARITGGLYLAFIVTSVLADVLGHIGRGNARQIYGTMTTSAALSRAGLVIALLSAFLFLMAAWACTSCCGRSTKTSPCSSCC